MMVQFLLTGPLFICSSHSWIEIQGPDRQEWLPNRKGGVAVSLTTSERLKSRSESHNQVTRIRKTFQTFAKRLSCAGVDLEKPDFLSIGDRLEPKSGPNLA